MKGIYSLIFAATLAIQPWQVLAMDWSTTPSCADHPEIQEERSQELQRLKEADQREREGFEQFSEAQWQQLWENDLIRRKRVGEILAEGCFHVAKDYMAASLIYQHGDVPDHYYQAFIWANRAVELGDEDAKHFVALTIDRYLVSIGKKQLFGSQAYVDHIGGCFCLQPIEKSFTDTIRKDYLFPSLQEMYQWLASVNEGKDCLNNECETSLKPTPHGSVPGFW